jgi:hypothetical protein
MTHRKQSDAGLPAGPLLNVERDALILHWLIAGIGAGMILFSIFANNFPSMIP